MSIRVENKNRIGRMRYIKNGAEIAYEYNTYAMNDEKAAEVLLKNALYSESAYYYIQAMEKLIKTAISSRVDVTNAYYATKLKAIGHSLDLAIDFFLELLVYGKEDVLAQQLEHQLKAVVFKNIRFGSLHNNIRYPIYNERWGSYGFLEISRADCEELRHMLKVLKEYLKQIQFMI